MAEVLKKRINRLKYELCRLQVCFDAGNYHDMRDIYFEMKLLLETKLNAFEIELAKIK